MTTFNIIMAIILIALSVTNAIIVRRYSRKFAETERYAAELAEREKGLQKRHNELDRWQSNLKDQCRRQQEWDERRKHIYANFEVLDSEEDKPTMKSIGKSLSSKIGYALRKEFPDIQERHDETKGGRKVYSVDFYVTPFDY